MQVKTKTRKMVLSGMLCAVLCVSALIVVPIGPVPFSMAFLALGLIGALLSPLYAAGSVAAYLILGLVGLPVFAGFRAGPGVLFGPTGGYLIGYFILVLAISLGKKYLTKPVLQALATVVGLAGCYLLGTLWFMFQSGSGFMAAIGLCVAPFALPDMIKLVVATALAQVLEKRLAKQAS